MGGGQLRSRVTFQRLGTGAGDGAGNYGEDFVAIAGAKDVAAQINPKAGREALVPEGIQGRRTFEVTIRYTETRAGIRVDDRMIDARDPSAIYNVTAPPINVDMHRKYLKILVELGGAAA